MDRRGYAIGIGLVAFTSYMTRHDLPPMDWRDGVFAFLAIALAWWCLGPSRGDGLIDGSAHKQPDDGVAFRLGKTLNGVFRAFRRRL